MAARFIDGPEQDWLDESEVAALLGVSTTTLDRMVAENGFPAGHAIRGQTVRWSWDDMVYWRLWIEKRDRITVPETPAGKKTGSNRVQPAPTEPK